ncbi:beta-1,4-N-acetylgalactosaminyltransferase bre-4-like [Cydia strobilella]|uniref:beta-1,4-N-acetylgalactosaminyltransferase bre-4-like n=1 Tax=Cydia strobilella TaxID=1100964 RepID=UPI0030065663
MRPWTTRSEALLNTAAAKEKANNPSLTQRPEAFRPKNVSDVTGKFYDFHDLNVARGVSDVNVVSGVNVINDVSVVSGVDVTNDVYVASGFKVLSDVNIVSDVTEKTYELANKERKLCDMPSDLGPISANTSDISLDVVKQKYPEVKLGGRYSPPDCLARHRVAIIVPYRDRLKNLATFLNHMHPFLIKQRLDYGIFIVEQKGTHEFNRGKLMNVGFLEAGGWQCYIFHDIDLLPLDQRNLYTCPQTRHPRLYDVSALEGNELKATLKGNFGGVSALTVEQFANANGYSIGYWGWGGEDNDLYYRLSGSGYTITQYSSTIARYAALNHKQKSRNPRRYRLLLQTMKAFQFDGLSSLEYKLVSKTHNKLYTHIVINIDHTYHEVQELFQEHNNFKHLKEVFVLRAKQSRLHDSTSSTTLANYTVGELKILLARARIL